MACKQMIQQLEILPKETEISPDSISDVKVDITFRKISKTSIGFYIWRIEEDRLEAESKKNYGTFVDDCAYIIYASALAGTYVNQDNIIRETKPGTHLERFIHFWLGSKVSEQKRSNVAYKIQELDTYFNNTVTEYRETQDNESVRFLSYFKKGIFIRSSVLLKSKEGNRLYQLRGRKWLRCVEMDYVSWEHFGSDFIMILQTEGHAFIWIGRSSSTIERRDAIDLVTRFQSNPTAITIVDDGYEQSMPEEIKKIFNNLLPLKDRVVNQNSLVSDNGHTNKLKIYKCSYKGTRLHLDQLDVIIPTKDDLKDSTTVYVLDDNLQGVWLWVGNQATPSDSINAIGNGRAFVKKKKYPHSTQVIRTVEGHEPIEFKRLFPHWATEWSELLHIGKQISGKISKLDSLTLCQRPKMAAETQLIDDGSGERIIYQITKDQIIELPQSGMNIFSTTYCYVMRYSVVIASNNPESNNNVGIQVIIYQWNGSEASSELLNKCEHYAKNTFANLQEKAMYVQMCEFDETPHFLQIFNGKLLILQGEKHFNHNNDNNNNNSIGKMPNLPLDASIILRVYGDASYNSKAVEVYPLTSMLSKECYVIKGTHIWVWCGQSSTGDAREMAKNIGGILGECSLVLEGKESKEFWSSVGNHINQPMCGTNGLNGSSIGSISPPPALHFSSGLIKMRPQPQLFLVWTHHGSFYSKEIVGFGQSDLVSECVYVLDISIITYIWIGERACTIEKEKYMELVQHYLKSVPIARRPTTAIAVVRQHNEPNVFSGLFENWNHQFWNNYVTYEQKRQQYAAVTETINGSIKSGVNGDKGGSPLPPVLLNKDFDRHSKYPILQLQQDVNSLPSEVNPLSRELHLTHDDFVSTFKMTFWEFDELPAWKKQELKKKYRLF